MFITNIGHMQLTIRWRHPGMAGKAKADILLQSCEGPEPMHSLLDTLFSSLAALQACALLLQSLGKMVERLIP